jgi:hypothetical protein
MMRKFLNHSATAILLPALICLGCVAISALYFKEYGLVLFIGLPILNSFLASFFWSCGRQKSFRSCYGIAFLSILTLGGMIALSAIDGLVCLIMALPLAAVLALIGTVAGKDLGTSRSGGTGASIASLLTLSFPFLVGFEHATAPAPRVREVHSSVVIDAPIDDVWKTVIAFPEIQDPPGGIFQMGIAYPIKARIEGQGVGAIRYCMFSTGDFVEPITTWDAPHLLAFKAFASV